MKNFLIKKSINLKNNKSYQKKKQFIRSLLENRETSYTKYFDSFMIVLILFSVVVLVLNKTYFIPSWILFIDIFLVSSIFLLEYLLRFWIVSDTHLVIEEHAKRESSLILILWSVVNKKFQYVFSITGMIDLLAIFPKFRIVRLLKLYHYLYGAKTLLKALSKKEFEFKFLGYILVTVVFSFASVLYVVEYGINQNITSFLDALYWALVTVSTVGYGDISPVTDMGKMVSMVGIIFGIAMISFVTSVMVSAFAERFDELRTHSSINSLYSMDRVVIINGYGYLGSRIAYYIKEEKRYNCVIIEEDKEKNAYAQAHGQTVIYGDGCSTEVMKKIYRRDNIVAMLTLKSSDIENIYFILNAKSYNTKSLVFSRISHSHLLSQYNSIKTDLVIDPYSIIHKRAFAYAKHYLMAHRHAKVVLFGYSVKSRHLATRFKEHGIEIKIYDNIKDEVECAKIAGFNEAEFINFEESRHLETLALEKNNLIICSMHDEALNHYLAISLKVNEFNGKIMALTDTKQTNRQLELAGADVIFDLYDESAKAFIEKLNEIEDKV